MATPNPTIKNTSDLRQMLLQTIEDVRAGKIDIKAAIAIGGLSGAVLNSAKIDLQYLRFHAEFDGSTNARVVNLVGEQGAQPMLEAKKIASWSCVNCDAIYQGATMPVKCSKCNASSFESNRVPPV